MTVKRRLKKNKKNKKTPNPRKASQELKDTAVLGHSTWGQRKLPTVTGFEGTAILRRKQFDTQRMNLKSPRRANSFLLTHFRKPGKNVIHFRITSTVILKSHYLRNSTFVKKILRILYSQVLVLSKGVNSISKASYILNMFDIRTKKLKIIKVS